jgi:hypothetical protein
VHACLLGAIANARLHSSMEVCCTFYWHVVEAARITGLMLCATNIVLAEIAAVLITGTKVKKIYDTIQLSRATEVSFQFSQSSVEDDPGFDMAKAQQCVLSFLCITPFITHIQALMP